MSAALRSRARSSGVVVTRARGWDALAARINSPRSLSISFRFCCGGRCGTRSVEPVPEARSRTVSAGNAAQAAPTVARTLVLRAQIVRFAQGKPVRGKAAHFVATSIAPAKSTAESRQLGKCAAAARAAEEIF